MIQGAPDAGEPISATVISEVAAVTGRNQTEIEQLQETLDVDALNDLFESDFNGTLTFEFAGCTVIVDRTGAVQARPLDDAVESGKSPRSVRVD